MPRSPQPDGRPEPPKPVLEPSVFQLDEKVNRLLPEFKDRLAEAPSARTADVTDRDLGEAWVEATLWMAQWKFGLSDARVKAIVKGFFRNRAPVLIQEYQGLVRSVGDDAVTIEFEIGDALAARRIRRENLRGDRTIQVGDVVDVTTTMSVLPIAEYRPTREELEQLKRAVTQEQSLRDRRGREDQ